MFKRHQDKTLILLWYFYCYMLNNNINIGVKITAKKNKTSATISSEVCIMSFKRYEDLNLITYVTNGWIISMA